MQFVDSHAHLDDERFDKDREEVIRAIRESGVAQFISAGYSVESSERAVELSRKYDFIYATCGVSPNDNPQNEEELWKAVKKIEDMVIQQRESGNNKIVAIGEIGLDYYWEKDVERRELQKQGFIKQIEVANRLELPIVIHTRDAYIDTIQVLREHQVDKKGVFHCCPQNRELINDALALGFYISFAGPITFKNAKQADEVIMQVPNDRLLIETDSPYLSPEPLRGKRNTPANVRYVAEKIASVKGISIEEVAHMTYENVKRIFEI